MSSNLNECEEAQDPLLPEKSDLNKFSNRFGSTKKKCLGKNRSNVTSPEIFPNSLRRFKKKNFTICIICIVIIIYLNTSMLFWDTTADEVPVYHHSHLAGIKAINLPPGYLVYSDKCKIPDLDIYASDIMKSFKRNKYQPCSSNKPLTSTKYYPRNKTYILHLEESLRSEYTNFLGRLDCCYNTIKRPETGANVDRNYDLSECLNFTKSVQLPVITENILVKCKSWNQQTYINAHAMIPERPDIRKRLDEWTKKDTKRHISVLLLGIDSISRQNLYRAMPKTTQHLIDSEWFEMSGYNKVEDNTFPNLMAILAGYNLTTAIRKCNPNELGGLDKCPFIWYDFQKYGYVTAYAEDEAGINTFTYLKKGFRKPPVDYYLRPFMLAAEAHLPVKRKSQLTFCLAYQHSADYIYDYALEFATNYKDDPYFGLFWMNSFSHNLISDCSSMDQKMVSYLNQFSERGIMNRTIIIFFSDHGMRMGPTRKLLSGFYEDRLPFMFIWLPPWLKNDHPEFADALNVNKNRLTNPYDIHMTLKHILELSGRAKNLRNAEDCPNCQSLLRPVPHNRSCEDIAIGHHWCTCYPLNSISSKIPVMNIVTAYTIDYINKYVASFKNGSVQLCANISLHQIKSVQKLMPTSTSSTRTNATIDTYRIVFETNPRKGLFEATVRHNLLTNDCEVTDSISRINFYGKTSDCISDEIAKKYCFCTYIKSTNRTRG